MDDYIPREWTMVMSRLGTVCHKVHTLIASGSTPSNSECEDLVMRVIHSDVHYSLRDHPLARHELGSKIPEIPPNFTEGPAGEEARYFGMRAFPSGSVVGLLGVWPGHSTDTYAIAIDEKFPEFFGLYYRASNTPNQAERTIADLKSLESERNEELGQALVRAGWYQLVPTRTAAHGERVPAPSIRIQPPERTTAMPITNELGRVIEDINGMVRAAVSPEGSLPDPVVRRTLAFLSQVILVVEQAFQDVLTILIDVQYLHDSPELSNELRELSKRVELLTSRSYYRDAAEICSRLKHLRENYDKFVRPAVQNLKEFSDWQGLFGLIEEREGRIIMLVQRTANDLANLLSQAERGDLRPLKSYAAQQASELRAMLSDLHALNGRILGLSGKAGFLELTRDRNMLEREVNIHVDQRDQSTTHGNRVSVGSGNTFCGDFVVANSIQDSFKRASEASSSELRLHLEQLCGEVESLAHTLPKETATQLSQDLSTLVTEASKPQPRRKWVRAKCGGARGSSKSLCRNGLAYHQDSEGDPGAPWTRRCVRPCDGVRQGSPTHGSKDETLGNVARLSSGRTGLVAIGVIPFRPSCCPCGARDCSARPDNATKFCG